MARTKKQAMAALAEATGIDTAALEPVAALPNPFAALVQEAPAAAPAVTSKKSMLAKALAVNSEVTVGALAGVKAANNVAARATSLNKVPTLLSAVSYTLGRPCKVRVPYTLACYEAVKQVLGAGPATGGALSKASTGDFVKYAVKNGWLIAA